VVLEVRDDGKGIAPSAARGPKSLGLLGVRERARRLGGTVSVEPGASSGTVLSLRVPRDRVSVPGPSRVVVPASARPASARKEEGR